MLNMVFMENVRSLYQCVNEHACIFFIERLLSVIRSQELLI